MTQPKIVCREKMRESFLSWVKGRNDPRTSSTIVPSRIDKLVTGTGEGH